MNTSFRRRFAVAAVGLFVGGVFTACGGATAGTERGGPKPGDPPNDAGAVCTAGAHRSVDCNQCDCVEGEWVCTSNICPQPICKEGEQRPQGCTSCTCVNGDWQCPLILCPEPVCADGSTKQSDDGCNQCTCMGGQWGCTQRACPPPDPICKEGESMSDGCNGCTCSGGQWACTDRYCPPAKDAGVARGCGGWLGDTCSAVEYCAYTPGQYCGGADASSTCKPRPTACDDNYDPVCGCDGKTYPNACGAAASGTGVMSKGSCQLPQAF